MKPIIHMVLVAVLVLAVPLAHAEEEFEPKPPGYYLEHGVTIVLPTNWKPFSFVNETGEHVGYLPDLWKAWAARAELPHTIKFQDTAEALETMQNREADVFGGLYFSDEREEYLDFADSLYSATTVLGVMDSGSVDCSNAMSRGVIAVVDGSRFAQAFSGKYPEGTAKGYFDAQSAVVAFLDGNVDGVAVEYTPLIKAVREQGKADRLEICRTVYYDEIYAAVQKDEEELLKLVNEAFDAIAPEEWAQIEARWFEKEERRKIAWKDVTTPAGVTLFFILGVVYLWLRRRRIEKERRAR